MLEWKSRRMSWPILPNGLESIRTSVSLCASDLSPSRSIFRLSPATSVSSRSATRGIFERQTTRTLGSALGISPRRLPRSRRNSISSGSSTTLWTIRCTRFAWCSKDTRGLAMSDLSHAELRRRLDYDPDTGVFTWKVSNSNRALVGSVAGTTTEAGYISISIDVKFYRANRLVWFWMTGSWPENQIDHKNTVRDDNRWVNLRKATITQNNGNQKPRKGCTSEFKGVYLYQGKKWRAQIGIKGRPVYLGSFDQEEEAAAAYAKAANDHFGEFARTAA